MEGMGGFENRRVIRKSILFNSSHNIKMRFFKKVSFFWRSELTPWSSVMSPIWNFFFFQFKRIKIWLYWDNWCGLWKWHWRWSWEIWVNSSMILGCISKWGKCVFKKFFLVSQWWWVTWRWLWVALVAGLGHLRVNSMFQEMPLKGTIGCILLLSLLFFHSLAAMRWAPFFATCSCHAVLPQQSS